MNFYETSIEIVQNIISDEKYNDLILKLQNYFYKTHIDITEIDSNRDEYFGYYFEYVLTAQVFESGESLLYKLYKHKVIDEKIFNFFNSKINSLFKIKKIEETLLILIDLFDSEKIYNINMEYEDLLALKKGDIIQGFIYFDTNFYLSKTSIIHYREVSKFIEKTIKPTTIPYKNKVLEQMFRNYVNSHRYSNISPEKMYKMNI